MLLRQNKGEIRGQLGGIYPDGQANSTLRWRLEGRKSRMLILSHILI
jgi:hypothetical protein